MSDFSESVSFVFLGVVLTASTVICGAVLQMILTAPNSGF